MARLLTPRRIRGVEFLDEAGVDPKVRRRSHRDIALANRLFGGSHAMLAELQSIVRASTAPLTLLDVGTGTGDIPAKLARWAALHGKRVRILGLDDHRELVMATRDWPAVPVIADALSLPFASKSVDIVCCSQTLHHFADPEARRLVQEMHRVARLRVVIGDLQRNWVAIAALWLFSFPLRFHPISRHDGIVSIFRGFTRRELRNLVREAVGVDPIIRWRFAFRVTASWRPA